MWMFITAVMGVAAARAAQILWLGLEQDVPKAHRPSVRPLSSI